MKKLFLFFVTVLILGNLTGSSAMFTTSPAILQEESKNVKILFDPQQQDVAALKTASVLYAHIGVTLADSPTTWTHVIGEWNTNTDNKKFVKNADGLWELAIGDIHTYFGLSAGEKPVKIAVIARTADGKSQTADNFLDIYGPGFQMNLSADKNTVINTPTTISFTVASSENCTLSLSVDDKEVKRLTNSDILTVTHDFKTQGAFNKVTATATTGTTTLTKELTVAYPGMSPVKDYPGGKPRQGAVRNADGTVTFCLAAPQKQSVMVIGKWDDYNPTAGSLMNRCEVDGISYFWVTTEKPLADGEYLPYYYLVDTQIAVGDPYAKLVLDPWNDRSLPAGCFEGMPEYPYDRFNDKMLAVYKSDIDEYEWDEATLRFNIPDKRNLTIYEVLLRDFTGDGSDQNGKSFGTLRTALPKIDYLKNLGVNAVELMPVMEFNGNNSWGYNTNFYMALDKAYGAPDDLRDFVAECHRQGIAVILDIVFNQSDGLHPWYQMYPVASNPFYNQRAPHAYSVLNDWNQDYKLVGEHWKDVVRYWMEAYKVDGFRFDLVKGLGSNSSYGKGGNAETDAYNSSRVARMKELHEAMKAVNENAIHINELLGETQEENENGADGQLNWKNLNGNAQNFAKGVGAPDLRGFYASEWGRVVGQTVDYAESHDEKRIARAIVEGGNAAVKYTGATPSEGAIRRLGAVAAQMLCCPGAKMIWQFGELAADDMQGSDLEKLRAIAPKWDDLKVEERKALHDVYRQLCHLRVLNPDLFAGDKTEVVMSGFSGPMSQPRTLVVRNGVKEVVALFNADVTGGSKAVSAAAAVITPENGQLVTASWKTEPKLTAPSKGMVSAMLAPGEWCVYSSAAVAGDEVAEIAPAEAVKVYAANGCIVVAGQFESARAYSMQGGEVPVGEPVEGGVYVVNVDGRAFKIVI